MKFTDSLRVQGSRDYVALADALAAELAQTTGPIVFGIAGAQGTGKSTFAGILARTLAEDYSESVVTLSLDDFYLTRDERTALSRQVHPLLKTRGVPGTHDVALMQSAIDRLMQGKVIQLPVFDKAADDRAPVDRTAGPARIVLCEGWCWGARPENPGRLESPINDLERTQDADGRWRQWVNDRLTEYQPLFKTDATLFFAAPSMQAVKAWRWQQEQELARERDGAHIMSQEQIVQFIAYYERVTTWMLEDLPGKVSITAILDIDHGISDIRLQQDSGDVQ